MPGHLRAGHRLNDADVQEMAALFARWDRYIRFLYHREMEFSQTLGKVISSPTFRLARQFAKVTKLLRGKSD